MPAYRWDFETSGSNEARGMVAVLTRLENITGALTTASRQLAGIQGTLAQGFSRLTATTQTTNSTVDASTTIINNFGRQTQGTTKHVDSLFQKMLKAAHIWNTFNAAVSFAKTRLKELGGMIGSVMSVGMGFESQEASLKGLVDNYQPVIDKAKELGATTKFSAEQSAAGAVELAKAGLNSTQIIDSLGATLQAAEANSITVGQAGKVAAVGMNQFTRSGESAAEILQIYTAAANASSTAILPLSQAMKNAAGVASLLGLNAAKTATFMSLMGSKGIEAGAAGTQLKIALQNLSAVTPRAQKALDTLGINVKSLNLADPVSWLTVFSEKLKKVPSDAEKIALIKPIMGEAVTGMLPILIEGGDAFKKMMDQITGGMGKMASMQQAQASTVGGAWEGMKSAAEGVALGIYDLLKVPILQWFNTWQGVLGEVGNRLNEVAKRFVASKSGIQEWIDTMKTGGLSGLFDDLLLDLEPQINQLKSVATAAWETVKALIKEGFKSIFTGDVADMLKRQAIDIFKAAWAEIVKIPDIHGVSKAIDAGKGVATSIKNRSDRISEEGEIIWKNKFTPITGAFRGAREISRMGDNNQAWEQQAKPQLDFLGRLEAKKREIERIPLIDRTGADTQRLARVNENIQKTEGELRKLADEYKAAGKDALVTGNAAFNSVITRTATPQAAQTSQKIDVMKYADRKEIKNRAMEIETGGTYQRPTIEKIRETAQAPYKEKMSEKDAVETRIQQLIKKGFSEKQARMVVGDQRAQEKSVTRDASKQAAQTAAQQALDNAKQLADTKKMQEEQDRAAEKEAIDSALKLLAVEKERMEQKKKMRETEAAIANAPIEAQMEGNKTENAFQKFLIEPVNAFTQKIGDIFSKFTETLSGMGNKRTDIKLKGGLINEEQAKAENVDTLTDSLTRGEKMLKIAQGAGQKADAYEAQAGRLAELGQLTGDQSKTQQADALMKKAIDARKQDEENQIKKVELDQELAKKNVKSLESKKDGSAAESVSRLQQLFDSYTELGDVKGAAATKEALQKAQRDAAGEQVGVLKMILEELKLGRKSNELAIENEAKNTQQAQQQTAQQIVTAVQNSGGYTDPALQMPY